MQRDNVTQDADALTCHRFMSQVFGMCQWHPLTCHRFMSQIFGMCHRKPEVSQSIVACANGVCASDVMSRNVSCRRTDFRCHGRRRMGDQVGFDKCAVFEKEVFLFEINFLRARDLDFVFITETWLNTCNRYVLGEDVPNNCTVFNSRQIGRGGGLASIFKDNFICTLLKFDTFSSFKLQSFEMQSTTPVLVLLFTGLRELIRTASQNWLPPLWTLF